MKKVLSLVLVGLLTLRPVLSFAATTEDNLQAAKDQTLDALKELQNAKGPNNSADAAIYQEKGSAYSEYKTSGLGANYYRKTAESPYTMSKIAEAIAALAQTAASAIGTSMQLSAAAQMASLAADLKASGVPNYQPLATSLAAESGYVSTGDTISAQQTATNIAACAATTMPVDTSYKPTTSETAALSPFSQFFKGFLDSVLPVLSSAGMQVLMAALGSIFGPLGTTLGTIMGGSLGPMISNMVTCWLNNTPISDSGTGAEIATGINTYVNATSNSITASFKVSQTPVINPATSSSSSAVAGPTQVVGSSNPGATTIQKSSTDVKAVNNN
jgi:hypothetical protein